MAKEGHEGDNPKFGPRWTRFVGGEWRGGLVFKILVARICLEQI